MKLLLLAHYFPPMGGAGVQRALKFAKYLGAEGVQVSVLAGQDPAYLQDGSLLAEIPPGLDVQRVAHTPLLQRLVHLRRASAPPTDSAPAPAAKRPAWRDAALAAWATLQWPDAHAGWARAAEARALAMAQAQRFDLILSSAPPVSSHRLAARLSARLGVPWVADWRDLWTDNPAYAAPAWRRALDRRLEDAWLASAAGVVTVTPTLQRTLAARLGGRREVALVPNGYDEADFDAIEVPPPEPGVFRVVHAGTLYGHQSPLPLLLGADRLLGARPGLAGRLKLRLVGQVGARFHTMLAEFDATHPGVLERTGYVEHRQAVAEMLGADLLLLVIGGGAAARGVLSGKVFEYLRAARPVLLVGPADGDAAQLLRAHAASRVAEEGDVAGIADALGAALDGRFGAPPAGARPGLFERRALTAQLAVFLQRCVEQSAGQATGKRRG